MHIKSREVSDYFTRAEKTNPQSIKQSKLKAQFEYAKYVNDELKKFSEKVNCIY